MNMPDQRLGADGEVEVRAGERFVVPTGGVVVLVGA